MPGSRFETVTRVVSLTLGRGQGNSDNRDGDASKSPFEDELIRNCGRSNEIDELESAVAEYVNSYNYRCMHGELGHIPPVEDANIFPRICPPPP